MNQEKVISIITMSFKVLAIISAVIGFIFFLLILIGGGTPEAPRATSLIALALGVVYFLFFYTAAVVVELIARIEANTRR